MRRALILVSLIVSVAAPAAAQDASAGEIVRYDFMDDLVTGGRYDPDGEVLHVRGRRDRDSLIRARAHFVPELLKSIEHI
jgi:hypothetical protein